MRRSKTWTGADDEGSRAGDGEGPVTGSREDVDFVSGETALRRLAVAEASTKETLLAGGGVSYSGMNRELLLQRVAGRLDLSPGTAVGIEIGRYRVDERLGEGGMGVVYRAHDEELDRDVAIKVLRARDYGQGREEARTRLRREARAMARLNHPHVVKIHEVGVHDGRFFIAMELVDGVTLME